MKYDSKTLPERDLVVALAQLLVDKGVFSGVEFLNKVMEAVDEKNKQIEEYEKENPGMGMIMDMMSGTFEKKEDTE